VQLLGPRRQPNLLIAKLFNQWIVISDVHQFASLRSSSPSAAGVPCGSHRPTRHVRELRRLPPTERLALYLKAPQFLRCEFWCCSFVYRPFRHLIYASTIGSSFHTDRPESDGHSD